jgi:hypothetical protein
VREAIMSRDIETIQEAARQAVLIQDASNIGPVIRLWGRMQTVLYADADKYGVNYKEHHLQVLMLSKITSLMPAKCDGIGGVLLPGKNPDWNDAFSAAYGWALDTQGEQS